MTKILAHMTKRYEIRGRLENTHILFKLCKWWQNVGHPETQCRNKQTKKRINGKKTIKTCSPYTHTIGTRIILSGRKNKLGNSNRNTMPIGTLAVVGLKKESFFL